MHITITRRETDGRAGFLLGLDGASYSNRRRQPAAPGQGVRLDLRAQSVREARARQVESALPAAAGAKELVLLRSASATSGRPYATELGCPSSTFGQSKREFAERSERQPLRLSLSRRQAGGKVRANKVAALPRWASNGWNADHRSRNVSARVRPACGGERVREPSRSPCDAGYCSRSCASASGSAGSPGIT